MLYKNKPIPDSVTSIKRICRSTLIIPTSVKTINEVSGENGILMLSIKRVTPPNIDKAIYLAKDDVLIVPKGAARAYNNHSLWGKFKNISEDPSLQESASIRSSNNGDDDFNSVKIEINLVCLSVNVKNFCVNVRSLLKKVKFKELLKGK